MIRVHGIDRVLCTHEAMPEAINGSRQYHPDHLALSPTDRHRQFQPISSFAFDIAEPVGQAVWSADVVEPILLGGDVWRGDELPAEIVEELAAVQETAREEERPVPTDALVADADRLLRRMYAETPFPYDVTPEDDGGIAIHAIGTGISLLVILSPEEDDQFYVSLDGEDRRSIYEQRDKIFDGRFLQAALRDLADYQRSGVAQP